MGKFTRAIRTMQRQFAEETEAKMVRTPKGFKVKAHAKTAKKCPKCGKPHSANEHRFHGVNAHLRTHGKE